MASEGGMSAVKPAQTWVTLAHPGFCLVVTLATFFVASCGAMLFGQAVALPVSVIFAISHAMSFVACIWGVIVGFVFWRKLSRGAKRSVIALLIWLPLAVWMLWLAW